MFGGKKLKKSLKTIMTIAISVMVLFSSTVSVVAESVAGRTDRPILKFNSDKKFKIMMINDTQDTDKTIKDTIKLINNSLDKEKPDLVVLVGDNIAGYWLGVNEEKVSKAIDNIVKPINDRNIPFAVVFGNHDQESGVSKEKQMKMYMSYKNCLAIDEGDSLSNCGTYNLLIKDSTGKNDIFNIWMIDSGTSSKEGGYQSVNADQIAWYEKTSNELKSENGGKPLPSLLFQHIPVPEIYDLLSVVPAGTKDAIEGYRTLAQNYYLLNTSIAQGKLLEAPCSPDKNAGEFMSWVKQGDILGAYFGHDHVNELKGSFDGIDLGYTPGAGFNQYGNGVYRGVRTFELDETDIKNYKTQVLYYKDLVAAKADTTIYDSYSTDVLRVEIPMALSGIIVIMLILLFVIIVVRKIQSKMKR